MGLPKHSFIDQQELASQFNIGDTVLHVDPLRFRQAPYKGIVVEVHRGIGQVDVKFPFGIKRLAPENLILSEQAERSDEPLDYPDDEDDSGSDLSTVVASRYMEKIAHVAMSVPTKVDELSAYDRTYKRYASKLGDSSIREAVKIAMYWKNKGRQYVPSTQELETGVFSCPRCKCEMRQTVYKKRTKLYACPDCLFLIKPADILECFDAEEREEKKKQLGWTDPSSAFNSWL